MLSDKCKEEKCRPVHESFLRLEVEDAVVIEHTRSKIEICDVTFQDKVVYATNKVFPGPPGDRDIAYFRV